VGSSAGKKLFQHAYYFDLEGTIHYQRRWAPRLSTEVAYSFGTRRYNAPFPTRRLDRHELAVVARPELRPGVELGFGASAAWGHAPVAVELGQLVDRSSNDAAVLVGLRLRLPARIEVDAESEVRVRSYTTLLHQSRLYFDRVDHRLTARLNARLPLGQHLAVVLRAAWTRNDTNRADDPALDNGELGYEEAVATLGLNGAF
jgi:hypothetical protein